MAQTIKLYGLCRLSVHLFHIWGGRGIKWLEVQRRNCVNYLCVLKGISMWLWLIGNQSRSSGMQLCFYR